MEQRLFIVACIMYLFFFISKRWFKKAKPIGAVAFGLWHGLFLLFILGCAYYIFNFIMKSSAPTPLPGEGISAKTILIWLVIGALSVYGFFHARKKMGKEKDVLIKKDLEWANTVYFAGFVASIVMFFFVQAFKIPSASMRNTLLEGDHLFVNKAVYGFRIPLTQIRFFEFNHIKPQDIIVFTFPADTPQQVNCGGLQYGRDFVKRVIAGPGDKVEVRDAQVYVNDRPLPRQPYEIYDPVERLAPQEEYTADLYQALWEDRVLEHEVGISLRDNFGPVTVPQDSYFAMGDNRDNSCDSRFWGPVPRQNIKGTAWFIHWPLSRIRLIK